MFACTSMAGMAIGTPMTDVCKTPTPAGPQPMPYPNLAQIPMTNPGTTEKTVTVLGQPVLNNKSVISHLIFLPKLKENQSLEIL